MKNNLLVRVNTVVTKEIYAQSPLLAFSSAIWSFLFRKKRLCLINEKTLSHTLATAAQTHRPQHIKFSHYWKIFCTVNRSPFSKLDIVCVSAPAPHGGLHCITTGWSPIHTASWMFHADQICPCPAHPEMVATAVTDSLDLWAETMMRYHRQSPVKLRQVEEATLRYINNQHLPGDILLLGFSAGLDLYRYAYPDEVGCTQEELGSANDAAAVITILCQIRSRTPHSDSIQTQNLAAILLRDLANNNVCDASPKPTPLYFEALRAQNFTCCIYPPLLYTLRLLAQQVNIHYS